MAYADEQSYEEVIAGLTKFKQSIISECGRMLKAGQDCIDNMDNDPAAKASCKRLTENIKGVEMNLELIDSVIKEMQAQIERIREKAAKASQY